MHIIPLHGKVNHKCITVTDVHTYKLILTYVQQESLKYWTDCLDIYTYITKHIWKKYFSSLAMFAKSQQIIFKFLCTREVWEVGNMTAIH